MPISATPYREPRFATVNGRRMAYIDEGVGDAIVFQHGNPTSSYLWRNIMPHCEGLGRLIACDLIGMGHSDKLPDSGPERYSYHEQRDYLFALWHQLNLGDKVIMVLHDWGSLLGFDWTHQHAQRVQGIVYMEAIVQPITWADWPEDVRSLFQGFRSKDGETMVLEKNLFVEQVLPGAILRRLSEDEMAAYRAPFAHAGEDRRPTLTWPRQIPIEGEPPEVVRVATDCGRWLAESRIPKLFINAEAGAILRGRQREFCRTWPNQTEVAVLNNLSNEPGRTPLTKARPLQSVGSFDEKEREKPPSPPIRRGNSGEARPFTNIVVAFNGSQESKRALEVAARLVRITGASLQTITVLNPLPAYTAYATAIGAATPALLERGVHQAYKGLQEEARQIAMKGGASVKTHLVEGGDVKPIIRFISEVGADLLVIGIHRHRLRLSSLWSTAYDLAQHAACSVLGVP